jgi:hypothetical protein
VADDDGLGRVQSQGDQTREDQETPRRPDLLGARPVHRKVARAQEKPFLHLAEMIFIVAGCGVAG